MMEITAKAERRIKYVLVSLMVICLTPLCESGRKLNGAHSKDVFAGKDIRCVIDLGNEMYGSHGLETGMNYELLNMFAQDNNCSIDIISAAAGNDYLDSLRQGKVDIVITHAEDVPPTEGIELSRMLNSCSAWAVSKDRYAELRQINIWISHITESKEFASIVRRYSATSDPIKRAEKGVITNCVSPYDDLLRKYAVGLGWDWRMLAAVVYQESRFSINSSSHRGAKGLMQVMPGTAEYYGICNLLDPEANLMAGTSHLKRLQRIFSKYGLEQDELIKFTLAAYNAGEGKIAECRDFAASQQADNTRWDETVKIIPMMRELGMFQGHETIAYVDSIMAIYEAICRICPNA